MGNLYISVWRNTPLNEGSVGQVGDTLVADVKHDFCHVYYVQHPDAGVAFRASLLIDDEFNVRHQVVNDLPLGRDVDKMLRMAGFFV